MLMRGCATQSRCKRRGNSCWTLFGHTRGMYLQEGTGISLQFNVDFAFIENVPKDEVKKDEIDGIGERSPLERRN